MRLFFKCFWYFKRYFLSLILGFFFKITQGSFLKKIGYKNLFFGVPRFGSVEGNITIGSKCLIGKGVFFSCVSSAKIEIGDNCSLNTNCHIVANYGIVIGSNTRIAEFVSIRDQNHQFNNSKILIRKQGFFGSPIIIGEDVWIGRGVLISHGVNIGNHSIVAANSVVNKSFPPNSIIGGVPAKLLKQRI